MRAAGAGTTRIETRIVRPSVQHPSARTADPRHDEGHVNSGTRTTLLHRPHRLSRRSATAQHAQEHRHPPRHAAPRPEHVDLRPGPRSPGRHRCPGGLPLRPHPRIPRTPRRLDALARRASLQLRGARRIPPPPERRHVARPHPRTRDPRTAGARRHARRIRPRPRDLEARRLQGHRDLLAGRRDRDRHPDGPRSRARRDGRPPLRREGRRRQAAPDE